MVKNIFVQCLYIVLVLFVACDNEPYEGDIIVVDNSCLLAAQATADAAVDFLNSSEDDYTFLCQVYRDALQDQIQICGDVDGSLQALIDSLGTCILEVDPCEEAIEATTTARIIFESTADDSFEQVCNIYREALINQIALCGDDGTLQSIIDDLGDCQIEEVDVVGNWLLIGWITDELRDLNNDGIITNNYLDDIDCYDNETLIFNADGTGTMFLRSEAEFTFTPTDDGEDFFTVCNDISVDKDFTWTETINSVMLAFTDGSSLGLFKNGNLYTAIDDAFYAESTIDDSVITERITFVYEKQ